MRIVFQNKDFTAIDKESGYLSVPSRMGEKETRKIAGIELEKKIGQQIFPVHRLDAEVSGLLLFANHAAAHREANQAFEHHLVQKEYQAYSEGPLPEEITMNAELIWTCVLAKGKKRAFEAAHGKNSITHATCIGEFSHHGKSFLEWRLFPKTGRSHQLRYEMYRHDRSILGDALYGSQFKLKSEGIALRAVSLDFTEAHKKGLLKSLEAKLEINRRSIDYFI